MPATLARKSTTIKETWNISPLLSCVRTVKGGKLIDQYFKSRKPNETHPYSYEPKHMGFQYYGEDLTEFTSLEPRNRKEWPKSILIEDLDNINASKLICFSISRDGSNYSFDSKYPLSAQGYARYTSEYFNLDEIYSILNKLPYVYELNRKKVEYYNQNEVDDLHEVTFRYLLTPEITKPILDEVKGPLGMNIREFWEPDFKKYDVFKIAKFSTFKI